MTSRQKKQLQRLLVKRKSELDRRCNARSDRKTKLSGRAVGDLGDAAYRDDALEFMLALEEHDFKELRDLDDASLRMKTKDFGRCQACGKPIKVSRLLILPETELCYECAVSHEHDSAA